MKESFLAEPTQLERNLEGDCEAQGELAAAPGYNPSSSPSSCTRILHYKLQGVLNGHKAKIIPQYRQKYDFRMVAQRAKSSAFLP